MTTFGGDEVNALVLDIGSSSTRAGYAGEEAPKVYFPTSYGLRNSDAPAAAADGDVPMNEANDTRVSRKCLFGDEVVNVRTAGKEIGNPMVDGLIDDWDAMEQLWKDTFKSKLRVDTAEHPLLCTEPVWNTLEKREKMIELAFEKFNFPAYYAAKDAVMSAFSEGRSTALVLDSGSAVTSVVPVYDGFVLKKSVTRQLFGGDQITQQILEKLQADRGQEIQPLYKIKSKKLIGADQPAEVKLHDCTGITDSFHKFQVSRMIHEFKESVCEIAPTTNAVAGGRPFEFPDGFNRSFERERFELPGVLFSEQTNGTKSVQKLIFESIQSVDRDLRSLLANNVLITGGNTLYRRFDERLQHELSNPTRTYDDHTMELQPKYRVYACDHGKRKYSSWLGGSILASLGTFHQLWISKKEYEEEGGARAVERKCQ